MSKIQKTLDDLQPYVIGIRYLEGIPLVDVVFKEGWTLLDSKTIQRVKGNNDLNYHMIFSETPNVGLDELLEYIDRVIKANQDREKKHDLLRQKVNELKEIFKSNSLTKLNKLIFSFKDDEFTTDLNEIDISFNEDLKEEIKEPKTITTTVPTIEKTEYLDENGEKIVVTEEDKELEEEELRGERNRKIFSNKSIKPKVDLPPKRKIEMASTENEYYTECDCGPEEACGICIEKKDL